jgi:heme-degrading monooxygenase HmoA
MERGLTDTAKIATLSRSSLMVLVVSNRIPVAKGWEEDFERRWKQRKWSIAQSPGFIRTEVLRPMKGDDYVVMTYWRSKEDFEHWTESQAFMEAHANTPPKEAFTGPSKLEVHEIIAESPAATGSG